MRMRCSGLDEPGDGMIPGGGSGTEGTACRRSPGKVLCRVTGKRRLLARGSGQGVRAW